MLINLKWRKSNKLFRSLLLTIAIVIVLSIIILSFVYYINFEKIALFLVYSYQKDSLSQLSSSAVFMSDSANSLARQILFDPVINGLFNKKPDIHEEINGWKQIRFFSSTMRYVTSIYVYNGINNMIYSDASEVGATDGDAFFDKDIIKILKDYRKYEKSRPIPRKIPVMLANSAEPQTTGNVYTFINYGLQGNNTRLDNAVVINVSLDWMKSIIRDMDQKLQNDMFIADSHGKVVLDSGKLDLMADISDKSYFRSISASKSQSGYFLDKVDGEDSLVVYVGIPKLNWIFIRLIPVKSILSQITSVRNTTITIGFIILVIGLFASYIVSRITFKPIGTILNDLSVLQSESRKNTPALKQKMLQGLLLGNTEYSSKKLEEVRKYCKMNFDFRTGFILVLLKIDRYSAFCRKYNPEDRALLKFGVLNIASEIFSAFNNNESVDMNDDKMVLLINAGDYKDKDDSSLVEKIRELAKDMQSAVKQFIDITLTVTVGATGCDAGDMALFYNKVCQVSAYRIFKGYESIIFEKDIEVQSSLEYNLSRKSEKKLTDLLLAGNFEDVRTLYNEIIRDASGCSYKSFNFTIMKLAMLISEASVVISENYEATMKHDFRNFIYELNEMEIVQDIIASFDGFIGELVEIIDRKKSSRYDEIINTVQGYIRSDYMDKNLSINSLAEMVSLSPGYLGRLFKRNTSVALVDYINNFRIQKAKELLAATSSPINEIIDQVGFTNSNYFYPLFKKLCGVTPKEYRQNSSSGQEGFKDQGE